MSLSAAVSKISVTTNQPKLYQITLQLVLTDTVGPGFTNQYSKEYRSGESVSSKKQLFINDMQADIDNYKSSQSIFDSAVLDTAVSDIQSDLTL